MENNLDKSYNPHDIEDRIYKKWLDNKYFHAEIDKNKKPFTIVMPPPNITGTLHMGHALNNSLQDVLIRTKRMQGYSTLWVPGTDHSAISTEVKIVESLALEGISKHDLGRDAFLKRAWEWKDKYGNIITNQIKRLGCSCDWDRERFTMDDGLSNAVLEVFLKMYNEGLIYKGEKLINWCPNCQTTVSDVEVDHEEITGKLYYLKYPIKNSSEFLTFATTRPETMLGDTAIAVNPDDIRYKNLIGQTVIIPVVNREIPIIADKYVDMKYGSGVVKITPGHDPNDYEVGERHNLPIINILNDDDTINENGGKYNGMNKNLTRTKILEEFEELNLLVKIENLTHSVGVHERCHEVIEPLLKLQWFVKMDKMAKEALDVYTNGELKIIPNHVGKIYSNWLENIKDWCISRQIWWGHRIPAYYCEDCGHMIVSKTMPDNCEICNFDKFIQDEDTLDTWFSSALWPFSTLGWPNKTPELEYFFPTNVLVTASDIIFFWVARMVFSSLEQMGQLPFTDVFINGIVRDDQGKKMSKSLGNGIDPLEIIDEYGCDALRLTLLTGTTPGNDLRFNYDKLISDRTFLNKLWNATRFVLMNLNEEDKDLQISNEELTPADKWIISKSNNLIKNITSNIDSYELGIALQNIYDFVWHEYCDWYIEMVKPRLYNENDKTRNAALYTLQKVLTTSLKLLHPFLPFITEEIFCTIQSKEETIMNSSWPVYNQDENFIVEEKEIEILKEAVKNIRNIRAEMNVAPSKKVNIFIVSENPELLNIFENGKSFFKTLAYGEEIFIQSNKNNIDEDTISSIIPNGVIYMPFKDLINIEQEIKRLENEMVKLENEVLRGEQKLNNQGFISKAPEKVIEEENLKLGNYKDMLKKTIEQLDNLKK